MGGGGIAPPFLTSTLNENDQLHSSSALLSGKEPTDMRLCGFVTRMYLLSSPGSKIKRTKIYVFVMQSVSRDSAVNIATGYALDDRLVGVRVPVGSRIFTSPCSPDRNPGGA
jgi:hypothetical protein